MELKKSPKANLDKYGNLMIFIGFLLMSWIAYALINWRQTTTEETKTASASTQTKSKGKS